MYLLSISTVVRTKDASRIATAMHEYIASTVVPAHPLAMLYK